MFRDFFDNITNRLTFLETSKPQPEAETSKPKEIKKSTAPEGEQAEADQEAARTAANKESSAFRELINKLSPRVEDAPNVDERIRRANVRNDKAGAEYQWASGSETARGAKELITDAQKKQMEIANVLYDQVSDGMLSQDVATALFKKLDKADSKAFAEVVSYLQVNHAVAKRVESLQRVKALAGSDPRIEVWKSADSLEGKQAALTELKTITEDYNKSHAEASAKLAFDDSNDPIAGLES